TTPMLSPALADTVALSPTVPLCTGVMIATVGGTVSGGLVSSASTQPPSPSPLLPGVEKLREPEFANGEPAIAMYVPRLGSNQRAVAGALRRDMSTLNVRVTGVKITASLPSSVRAAVRKSLSAT